MRIAEMNWMQVEAYLKRDDRGVLPLGSTEQHGYLSLATDSLLAERIALEAAEPLGVPVFPVLPYGLAPYFRRFPGSVSLRAATYLSLVREILDSLTGHGFRKILIVNGHGGNAPAQALAQEWMADNPRARVRFHNWWNAPRTWAKVQAIDPVASHASWMENFPWTRLAEVALPGSQKPMSDLTRLRELDPAEVRATLGDGNYGGRYERSDEEMLALWKEGVVETREQLERPWG
jgi:creatinine amidohydrolase